MNHFAQRFHLICAIVAAFTCVLYFAIGILTVFVWHTAPRELFMVVPVLVLAAGAAMEFTFYTDKLKTLSRRMMTTIIIATAFVAIAGVQGFRNYRERNSVPPYPPAVCFPEPSAPPNRALEGEFEIITRVKRLPANLQPAFKEWNGKRWAIANPGEKFEETDNITDGSLPLRRLIFAGRSSKITFVHYEQGGRGLGYELAAFRTSSSKIDPLWRRHCPHPADNLNDLRSMVATGQCPTEAEWTGGYSCADGLH